MIKVEIADNKVIQALDKLARATENTRPVLELIGDMLVDSTRQRFATSTAPDGTRWASNSQVTILRYLAAKSGKFSSKGKRTGDKDGYFYKKGADKGRVAAKGIEAVIGKRPLIGHSGDLARQISPKIEGKDTLYIGSTMKYAAVQQFGAKRHEFQGKAPWGDIPDRPFLGISDQDRANILDTISDYLTDSFRP